MFERFTEPARRALFFARFEATQLGTPSIEVEQLLLGLLHPQAGAWSVALEQTGLTLDSVRDEFRPEVRDTVPTHIEIPFTAAAKRALEHAAAEADALSSRAITPAHLLIGIVRDEASRASQLLRRHGVTLDVARGAAAGTPRSGEA